MKMHFLTTPSRRPRRPCRHPATSTHSVSRRVVIVAASAVVLACASCATPGRSGGSAPTATRQVSIAEFSQPVESSANGQPSTVRASNGDVLPNDDPPSPASGGAAAPTAPSGGSAPTFEQRPPDPPRMVQLPNQPGARIVIDGVIGQINGRALYASEFFEEYDDRLLRTAEQTTLSEFEAELEQSVASWLRRELESELVMSEAESMLTPEMQRGLFAMLRDIEERRIAATGGTRSGAQSAMAREGLTLEEFVRQTRQEILVAQFQREVRSRVVVSWRDVERAYERRRAEFNPPGTMVLYRLALRNAEQAEEIETTRQRLADGEPFLEVAADLGLTSEQMRMSELTLNEDGEPADLAQRIRDAMPGFEVGDVSEPVESRTLTQWFYVAEVDQPPGRTVYDPEIQRSLFNDLLQQRYAEEWNLYMRNLFAQGSVQEIEAMQRRLLQLARARYAAAR